MKLLFWRNKKQTAKLDAIEHEAVLVHEENMRKLQNNRKNIDTLNEALRRNHITFNLVKAIGHDI